MYTDTIFKLITKKSLIDEGFEVVAMGSVGQEEFERYCGDDVYLDYYGVYHYNGYYTYYIDMSENAKNRISNLTRFGYETVYQYIIQYIREQKINILL